jgi:putative protease
MTTRNKPQLLCPAGTLPALKQAIDKGADAVYTGFRDDTNARNFAGLNFDDAALTQGVNYAHQRGKRVLIAINTFPQPGREQGWHEAVDRAAHLGADALILADIGLMDYAKKHHPNLALHMSVQGSATNYEAINFCQQAFGIKRVVIPRVLTLAQVKHLIEHTSVEVEVFGFGSLCVMNEGRCWLSSYATGESPNTVGACSPAKFVKWEKRGKEMDTRLNGILIDTFSEKESAGYPTLCKGRYEVDGSTYYAMEEPTSLNVLEALPELIDIGVAAIKVEGRQRSPAYVGEVTAVLRAALDDAWQHRVQADNGYKVLPAWQAALGKVSEGQQATLGAYSRPWR